MFDLGLVIPVVDAAIVVVVRACVEGVEGRDIPRAHMIGYDIHHYVHALCMGRADEGFEVVCRTVISVDGVDVFRPITMVTAVGVCDNRGYDN